MHRRRLERHGDPTVKGDPRREQRASAGNDRVDNGDGVPVDGAADVVRWEDSEERANAVAARRARVVAELRRDAARSNRAIARLVRCAERFVQSERAQLEAQARIHCHIIKSGGAPLALRAGHLGSCWCGDGDPTVTRKSLEVEGERWALAWWVGPAWSARWVFFPDRDAAEAAAEPFIGRGEPFVLVKVRTDDGDDDDDVEAVLRKDPSLGNRQVAALTGVSETTACRFRARLEADCAIHVYRRDVHADGCWCGGGDDEDFVRAVDESGQRLNAAAVSSRQPAPVGGA